MTTANEMWTMTVPVLSTAHLSRSTLDNLVGESVELAEPYGFCLVPMPYDGVMLFSDSESVPEDPTIPDDLLEVLRWAHHHGHDWIRFDRDGSIVDRLSQYEHP